MSKRNRTRIVLKHEDLEPEIRARLKALPGVVHRGLHDGVLMGRTILVRAAPTDRGELRNSFKTSNRNAPVQSIYTTAPHAGIVEGGARPHPVSREGWQAIFMWVLRHNLSGKAVRESKRKKFKTIGQVFNSVGRAEHNRIRVQVAEAITWAIVRKLKKHGQRPTYFVKNRLPRITKAAKVGVEGRLKTFASKPAARAGSGA